MPETRENDKRAQFPYVSPDQMRENELYLLVAHFPSARETRFVGPFKLILPIKKDTPLNGVFCVEVFLVKENRTQLVIMPPSGYVAISKMEYSLHECTPELTLRIGSIMEVRKKETREEWERET